MNIPALQGVIRRRILLNYRVDPHIVRKLLPARLSPKLVQGHSIAGICLIRLEHIRPKGFPFQFGVSSENSAHRIAVEWIDDCGVQQQGVFVPRRDTNSRLNSFAGGRLFPGVHNLSDFETIDRNGRIFIRIVARDYDISLIELEASETTHFPATSIFGTLRHSSDYFERGCIGYSSRPDSCSLDGLLLKIDEWCVSSLKVDKLRSAYFDDPSLFPPGCIEFDHALLMRDTHHEWRSQQSLTTEQPTAS